VPFCPRYRPEQRVEDERKLAKIIAEGDEVESEAGLPYTGRPTGTPECEREVFR
jgi:hypothetical protein